MLIPQVQDQQLPWLRVPRLTLQVAPVMHRSQTHKIHIEGSNLLWPTVCKRTGIFWRSPPGDRMVEWREWTCSHHFRHPHAQNERQWIPALPEGKRTFQTHPGRYAFQRREYHRTHQPAWSRSWRLHSETLQPYGTESPYQEIPLTHTTNGYVILYLHR